MEYTESFLGNILMIIQIFGYGIYMEMKKQEVLTFYQLQKITRNMDLGIKELLKTVKLGFLIITEKLAKIMKKLLIHI